MKPESKTRVGQTFEERARIYLEKQGYRLINRNFRCYSGEIDLVFEHHRSLVFVEVRSSKDSSAGLIRDPRLHLSRKKSERIQKAIQFYLSRYRGSAQLVRMDFVIFKNGDIEHFPDFWPINGQS